MKRIDDRRPAERWAVKDQNWDRLKAGLQDGETDRTGSGDPVTLGVWERVWGILGGCFGLCWIWC